MGRWPSPIEYQDAVSVPGRCFLDEDLQVSVIHERAPFGAPLPVAGQYAHVYRLRHPQGYSRAVRLFLREAADRSERYAAISRHLSRVSLRSLVPFDYREQGIRIGGAVYPIVTMDWVEGEPFHLAIERRLSVPGGIAGLAERFLALQQSLEQASIAHGDLQHDNMLVDAESGAIRLIDYDGMFVPEIAGRGSAEVGHPAYQHPGRNRTHYNIALDRFSSLVIYTSLIVLRYAPDLWYRFHNGDNLLFRRTDFLDPDDSFCFRTIRANVWRFPDADRALSALQAACRAAPLETAPLDRVV